MKRTIFYVSDGTGITSETVGNSLLTQFEGIDFRHVRIPFVDSEEKALAAVARIRTIADAENLRPIVINTVVDAHLCEVLARSDGLMVDVFAAFLGPLEAEFGVKRAKRINCAIIELRLMSSPGISRRAHRSTGSPMGDKTSLDRSKLESPRTRALASTPDGRESGY